jgi:hypothetical protein
MEEKRALVAQLAERRFRNDFSDFRQWLVLQHKSKWTIKQTVNFAKRYAHVLDTGNASELLTLSSWNRHHALCSLASYSRFTNCYSRFQRIRKESGLKWNELDDSIQAFQKMLGESDDEGLNYDSMLQAMRKIIQSTLSE